MHILLTVIRKRPEIAVADFGHFMEFDYGPIYAAMPQVRAYEQHYLADVNADDAEPPIDAIVRIAFDTPDAMKEALATDAYRTAHAMRERYMQATSVGIHSAVVERSRLHLRRRWGCRLRA